MTRDEAPNPPSPFAVGEGDGGFGFWRAVHLFALLVFLGLWTWKLLEPNPVPEAVSARLQGEARFVAAKGLHACGYSFLTLLAIALPVSNRWRWFFVGLLALHGAATEIGQTYVPGRTGSVRDVLIDWGGVILGVLLWRAYQWRAARPRSPGKHTGKAPGRPVRPPAS